VLFRKSDGETVYNKKALARPWQFLDQKGLDCHPRTGFCTGMMPQSTPTPQSRTSKDGEEVKMIH
jgi:hypothetical protein